MARDHPRDPGRRHRPGRRVRAAARGPAPRPRPAGRHLRGRQRGRRPGRAQHPGRAGRGRTARGAGGARRDPAAAGAGPRRRGTCTARTASATSTTRRSGCRRPPARSTSGTRSSCCATSCSPPPARGERVTLVPLGAADQHRAAAAHLPGGGERPAAHRVHGRRGGGRQRDGVRGVQRLARPRGRRGRARRRPRARRPGDDVRARRVLRRADHAWTRPPRCWPPTARRPGWPARSIRAQCERFGTPSATIGDAGAVCAVSTRTG